MVLLYTMKTFPSFISQKQGAELELKDSRGWTALYHCTSTGHQQMVKFLLDSNANVNVKWVSSVKLIQPQQSMSHYSIMRCVMTHFSPAESQGLASLRWWRLLLLDMKSLYNASLTTWVGFRLLVFTVLSFSYVSLKYVPDANLLKGYWNLVCIW